MRARISQPVKIKYSQSTLHIKETELEAANRCYFSGQHMLQSSITSIYVLKIHAAVPCIQWWLNTPPQETANFAVPAQVSDTKVQRSVILTEKLSISILHSLLEVQRGPGWCGITQISIICTFLILKAMLSNQFTLSLKVIKNAEKKWTLWLLLV